MSLDKLTPRTQVMSSYVLVHVNLIFKRLHTLQGVSTFFSSTLVYPK